LVAMFWIGLAIDYLPVILGASEMPQIARAMFLGLTGAVLAYVLYRWIFRRTFVRLADRSMALVLERRFDVLGDSLVTAVELTQSPERSAIFSPEMVARTTQQARAGVNGVQYARVFNNRSLTWKILLAVIAAGSIVALYSTNAGALER